MISADEIDWSKTSFDGSRREQLRRWLALTMRQRLEALDELTQLAERLAGAQLEDAEPPPPNEGRQSPVR